MLDCSGRLERDRTSRWYRVERLPSDSAVQNDQGIIIMIGGVSWSEESGTTVYEVVVGVELQGKVREVCINQSPATTTACSP